MNKWITGIDVDDLFCQLLELIWEHGETRKPRGMECESVGPVGITLTNPRARVLCNAIRNASRSFMAGEFTWIITGSEEIEQIAYYNNKMRNYGDGGTILAGAYGPRIADQISYLLKLFRDDPQTRQGVITIWEPNPFPSKDIPCTVSLHFRMGKKGLDLTTYMRSNDIWLGFPYDIFTFTSIQEAVAVDLGVKLGSYHHVVGDMHLYKEHQELGRAAFLADGACSEITPKIHKNLNELKTDLYSADKIVRISTSQDVGSVNLFRGNDEFINWIKDRLLERRAYHADRQKQHN